MARSRTARAAALLVATAALATSASASAATYRVSGTAPTIDADAGIYRMKGGLIGRLTTTSVETVSPIPSLELTGTERFRGCLDIRRDRSCAGDPSGTLSLTFRQWGMYESEDPASLIWGACWHPIVRGTGDFRRAQGVLTFVDTPTRGGGLKSVYIGNVRLKRSQGRKRSAHRGVTRPRSAHRAVAATTGGCGAAGSLR